jgi:hypothetical protein
MVLNKLRALAHELVYKLVYFNVSSKYNTYDIIVGSGSKVTGCKLQDRLPFPAKTDKPNDTLLFTSCLFESA